MQRLNCTWDITHPAAFIFGEVHNGTATGLYEDIVKKRAEMIIHTYITPGMFQVENYMCLLEYEGCISYFQCAHFHSGHQELHGWILD